MSTWDAIRAAVDAAEAADNAEFDAWQQTVAGLKQQVTDANTTIADLRAQLAALQPTIKWGSSVMPHPGETYPQALARVDKALAPEIIRFFIPGTNGPSWPTQTGTRPLVISFKLPPADVIAGKVDAQLKAFFAATTQLTYWSYWHEPENDNLDPAQYRQAWAHIAAIARTSGKPLRGVLILMEFTLRAKNRNWQDWHEADAVDVLGFDCYWRPGRTAADVYARPRSVAVAAGKPWAVCETSASSTETTPAQRQQVLHDMAHDLATVKPLPEFVCFFDSDPGPGFHWQVSDDPASAAAWKAGRAA